MRRLWLTAGLALILAALPSAASAQWGLKLGGGIGIITGQTSNALDDGWNGQIGAAFRVPKKPLGITFEFNNSWAGFNNALKQNVTQGHDGHQNIWSLTLNGMFTPVRKRYYKGPDYYLIGGAGFYSRYLAIEGGSVPVPCYPYYWWGYCSGTVILADHTDNAFGVNGGGGVGYNFGQGTLYLEARYHYAWMPGIDAQVVPIVLGFRFGW
jgi:hypothetical protein